MIPHVDRGMRSGIMWLLNHDIRSWQKNIHIFSTEHHGMTVKKLKLEIIGIEN